MAHETDVERKARTGLDSLRLSDEASAAVQKTPNRITLDYLRSRIVNGEYLYPSDHPHFTICVLTLDNGYILVGKAAPADPGNFDQELGKRFAREDAERQLWPLLAFTLREQLALTDPAYTARE
jgi:hypothetical protein